MIASPSPLPFHLIGPSDSTSLLVFLHSYPSTYRLFHQYYLSLEKEALSLILSFPEYPLTEELKNNVSMGHLDSLPLLVAAIRSVVQSVRGGRRVIMVSHGPILEAVLLYDQTFPKDIHRIFAIEGLTNTSFTSVFTMPFMKIAMEVVVVAGLFMVWRRLATLLSILFVRVFFYSCSTHPLSHAHLLQVNSLMGHTHYSILTHGVTTTLSCLRSACLPRRNPPTCPMVYFYSDRDQAYQQSNPILAYLGNTPLCQVHSLPDYWAAFRCPHQVQVLSLLKQCL